MIKPRRRVAAAGLRSPVALSSALVCRDGRGGMGTLVFYDRRG